MQTPPAAHEPEARFARRDLIDPRGTPEQVLVVVFLRGGADGLTLVPPIGDDVYHKARPLLAVDAADALALDGYFGLHPLLAPLEPYFHDGALSIIHGAGSEDDSRSHFEAQDVMEHGGHGEGAGWLARFLRARRGGMAALSAVSIGTTRPESMRGAPSGAVLQTIQDFDFGDHDPALLAQLARLYAVEVGGLGGAARQTLAAVERLREIRADAATNVNRGAYPDDDFGRGLREIATLIKADVGLVTSTIDLPGWDTHFVQGRVIPRLIRSLGAGLDAFARDLGPWRDRVTIVTMTEFGRRLRENSSFGTDHGAGSVMMVLDPNVETPGLRSGWPDLSDANLDDVGDVPASIDYRDVLAPILRRHDPAIDLARVFPATMNRP